MTLPSIMPPKPVPLLGGVLTKAGLLAGIAGFLMLAFAMRVPRVVEVLYGQLLYPPIARILAALSAPFPFSLAELLFGLVPLAALVLFFRGAREAWRLEAAPVASLALGLARASALFGVIWLLFLLLWGLNYARPGAATRFGLAALLPFERDPALIERVGQRLDRLRAELPEDERGVALMPEDLVALDERIATLQASLLRDLALPVVDEGRTKSFVASPLLLRWGVSGVYGPLTGEPQIVRPAAPTRLPFVIAHERAHLAGFASEEAANFVAFLTLTRAEDPALRYSGWLALWTYLREPARGRHPGVVRDLQALADYLREHRGEEAAAIQNVYDLYLRMHGVPDGVQSYGRVAGLSLAWLTRFGFPPEPLDPERRFIQEEMSPIASGSAATESITAVGLGS